MTELALLAAVVIAGAVALFAVSIRVGMLIGRRLDGWLQARYEAEQTQGAEQAEQEATAPLATQGSTPGDAPAPAPEPEPERPGHPLEETEPR